MSGRKVKALSYLLTTRLPCTWGKKKSHYFINILSILVLFFYVQSVFFKHGLYFLDHWLKISSFLFFSIPKPTEVKVEVSLASSQKLCPSPPIAL